MPHKDSMFKPPKEQKSNLKRKVETSKEKENEDKNECSQKSESKDS